MKRLIYNTAALFILAAALNSCKKSFLERPPLDQLTNSSFYKTDAEAQAGTAPLYNIVWFDYNDKANLSFGDARAGNMISNDRDQFYKFNVPATDVNTLLPAYQSFYKIIAQANTTMQSITNNGSNVSDAVKRATISECRYMRAMGYFFLVTNWGPVPIVYDNVKQILNPANLVRNDLQSIWKFIILDLRYASENLPAASYQQGRLNKWSAEGMLARAYLYRSGLGTTGTRNQSDLDSAKYYAGDVVKNSGMTLEANYADLFKSENNNSSKNNKESLFSLQWMPIKDPWGINNSFQAYMAKNGEITGSWDGWGAAHGASADLVKYYLANPADSNRRKATFMFPEDFYPEIRKDLGGYTNTSSTPTIANTKKYIIGSVKDNGNKGSEMCAYINTYMQRLAEVYLIYAEAILGNAASTSDADALKYYNAVRQRAMPGIAAKTSVTFDEIFLEKRIETAFEGLYWYELVRLYYYNPTKMKAMIKAQDKGAYTLVYNTGTNAPRTYTAVYNPVSYEVSDETVYFKIPEVEMIKAPSLSKTPVPFDFSLLHN